MKIHGIPVYVSERMCNPPFLGVFPAPLKAWRPKNARGLARDARNRRGRCPRPRRVARYGPCRKPGYRIGGDLIVCPHLYADLRRELR